MAINWSPNTADEVLQNVRTLIATEPGTVPFARDMGVPQDVVDSPESAAGALLQAAVFNTLSKYEPRAPLKKVTLTGDEEGKLQVSVQIGDL